MRVLQVHNRYRQPGGEDTHSETEGDLLVRAGHEVRRFEVTNPTGGRETAKALARAPWNRARATELRNLDPRMAPGRGACL